MENVKRITISSKGDLKILKDTLNSIKKAINGNGGKISLEDRPKVNMLLTPNYDFNPTLKLLLKVMKALGIKELLIKIDE